MGVIICPSMCHYKPPSTPGTNEPFCSLLPGGHPGLPTKMGADIIKRALSYPVKLIANNAGTNGSVVMQRLIDNIDIPNYGYNAATDTYEDLMEAGIIDPTKVVR
jgi:chaperonin GroEL (HSP60 family)